MEDTANFTRYITNAVKDEGSSNIAKKLCFNDTFEIYGKMKRKLSEDEASSTKNITDDSVMDSPWEIKRVRSSLSIAKNEIAQLQDYIEKQHSLRKEMESLFLLEKESLQRQNTNNTKLIEDLEYRISCLKRREQELKSSSMKSSSSYDDFKLSMESKLDHKDKIISQLQEEICSLKKTFNENDRKEQQTKKNNISQINDIEFKNQEYQRAVAEMRDEIVSLKRNQDKYMKMEVDFEAAKVEIHKLEGELANYKEYQTQLKAMQKKISTIPEIESELKQYRQEANMLRENVQNKLILEEQVHDLSTKLTSANNKLRDMSNIQVEFARVDSLLREWLAVGKDFTKESCTPRDLRLYIDELQKNELVLTADKLKSQSGLKALEFELANVKQDNIKATTQIADLKNSLKQHQNVLHRVQKKLQQVAKERDCYRNLVDSYDQDLTVMNTNNMNNAEVLLKERLSAAERIIEGYKEQVESLEKELQSSNLQQGSPTPPALVDQMARIKEDNSKLLRENERLTKRCDECEQLLEKIHQNKNSESNEKIVHFTLNPAAQSHIAYKEDVKELQIEIERLKKKIKKMEEGATDITQTQNMTSITELLMLREKSKNDDMKIQRLKDLCKSSIQEFRDVCYMMLGYKIDRTNTSSYRITNMYAENENEYLSFECDNGLLKLLETPYLGTLDDLVNTYLRQCDSIPAFLCALTLDLFKRTTIMNTTNTIAL